MPDRPGAAAGAPAADVLFWDPVHAWRRLLAEFVGTLLLTFVAAGGDTIEAATHQPLGHAAKVVAPALMVMALIYAIGGLSGAHLNPAVTLAFSLRGDFPPRRVAPYIAAQIAGAILAALLLLVIYGDVGNLGATLPHLGSGTALVTEIILTAALLLLILGTAAAGPRLVGHNSALAVGATIALLGLIASPISGASMNPARSLGPALVGGHMGSYWIYVVGPQYALLPESPATRLVEVLPTFEPARLAMPDPGELVFGNTSCASSRNQQRGRASKRTGSRRSDRRAGCDLYDWRRATAGSWINARIPLRGFATRRALLGGDRRPTGGSSHV